MSDKKDKQKILLVEDDVNLGFLLVEYLESNGFDVKLYIDGQAGLKGFQQANFDICIVDIMLPKLDGFSLVKEMKSINPEIAIIILSARSMKEDKIKGFGFGVDDYISKPFDEEELLCRIKAILNRRNLQASNSDKLLVADNVLGAYKFDPEKQELVLDKTTQRLTFKESKILQQLAQRKNKLVKREQIMIEVWGESDYFTGRSLDVFISKLRSYLKSDPNLCIKTIPTVGYILEDSGLK
ncbi:MAG: response regulator transcription factor [Bacteroidetes bacterium]|nr:response regulator transcription factor [Bacteroidota bacterium]MBT3749294.1 response regulator transcription factor [Bacteroidota bacterium]MBT4398247.1 response regulator transcription factor [Bacteroidota bacterium]MBT4409032.1 response regulator transcription factor [Bacteroidota bacterium]MBT5427844.1 response regulator transcription factor [Bacteroidota bacterium]